MSYNYVEGENTYVDAHDVENIITIIPNQPRRRRGIELRE